MANLTEKSQNSWENMASFAVPIENPIIYILDQDPSVRTNAVIP